MSWSDGENGKLGHSIQGKFPTNLNCHLKTKHYEQFKELQKKQSNKKEQKVEGQKGSQLHQDLMEHK